MLIRVPSLSWRPTTGSPFSCHPWLPLCWAKTTDSLRGALSGPGSRGGSQDPSRLRAGTFPLQRRLLPGHVSTRCRGSASLMDHTVRAGWQAAPVRPPLPPARVASSPTPFCLLTLSLVFRELRGLLTKAIMTPCLPMILFKALAIPFSHLMCEAGRVGNRVPILYMTELRVALANDLLSHPTGQQWTQDLGCPDPRPGPFPLHQNANPWGLHQCPGICGEGDLEATSTVCPTPVVPSVTLPS